MAAPVSARGATSKWACHPFLLCGVPERTRGQPLQHGRRPERERRIVARNVRRIHETHCRAIELMSAAGTTGDRLSKLPRLSGAVPRTASPVRPRIPPLKSLPRNRTCHVWLACQGVSRGPHLESRRPPVQQGRVPGELHLDAARVWTQRHGDKGVRGLITPGSSGDGRSWLCYLRSGRKRHSSLRLQGADIFDWHVSRAARAATARPNACTRWGGRAPNDSPAGRSPHTHF